MEGAAPRSLRRDAAYRGVLADAGTDLGRPLIHSALLHAALLALMLFGWSMSDDPPPLLKPDAFYVSAVVLPRAQAMPDKATRVVKPPPGEAGEKPTPPPKPDEMVLPEEDAPKREGEPEEPKTEAPEDEPTPKPKSRAELLAERGDPSDKERFATDVDGDADATPSALDPRFGKQMSRYDREIHDRVKERWQPGLALINQMQDGVSAVISFTITETGAIEDLAVADGSGNYAFDMSCAAAVQRAGQMQPPPKAPWSVSILFRPEEKR